MNYERLFNTDWHIIIHICSSTELFVCLFTTWNHRDRLGSTKLNRDQSVRSIDGKTSYRGHENQCHTSNGHYLLTATGRDVESICYVRCVALHAAKCNKYPSACNTVTVTFLWNDFSLIKLQIYSTFCMYFIFSW